MLYQVHEMQRAALEPWRVWAEFAGDAYSHPLSPFAYMPQSRKLAAGFELMLRLTQRYGEPDFGIATVKVGDRLVEVREHVVLDKAFCRLTHFAKKGVKDQPVVLVFAPLSGHFATLLRDTVRTLLQDHDVYITDWKDAREVPHSEGPFHFDDYVAYVREFIRFLGPRVHSISVCQPTVPVLAGISLMASDGEKTQPLTMTMMGGPIDTRRNPTQVNNFAKQHSIEWFEQHLIQRVPTKYAGSMRRVYPGFLQWMGFVAMNPDRHYDSHREFYEHLVQGDGESAEAHKRFYDEYNAVMDLPAEYYLETVERVFHEHALAAGSLKVGSQQVRPHDIRKTALFTIEGELDDISGHGQTQAAHGLCTGIPAAQKQHLLAKGVGHYGIFSGRKYREMIYPQIRDFIRAHN
jgi:poly(3-hydroxybutyrate) depolymerase